MRFLHNTAQYGNTVASLSFAFFDELYVSLRKISTHKNLNFNVCSVSSILLV